MPSGFSRKCPETPEFKHTDRFFYNGDIFITLFYYIKMLNEINEMTI